MMESYLVRKGAPGAAPSAEAFDAANPIRVEHYLWEKEGAGYRPEVDVRLYYNAEKLFLRFRTYEANPLARYTRENDPVYEDSCVECFLQPLPLEDDRYLNFEWNAHGAMLLGLGEGRKRERLTGLTKQLGIAARLGLRDPEDPGRTYWELACGIPFALIRTYFPAFRPVAGAELRGNFYKCGDATDVPHYGAWRPVRSEAPDFHRAEDFGTIRLE
ncbi:carbohydrate-binding family 9-like protein [Paenibacillus sp.]|uniref:carbohydrate-binding family 9-like protein n=1 Tax=Paenibacillus sp. TaxID=58172 RepID=UPI002D472126|nr:carbohydrate-binding family 9-like protein [Paenibacillus sp.]HZG57939.1 carbohydrate-binding family 9-like protein [Paenibacillus sp.]